jgi:DNA-binding NarL/FixJ family response regulator
MEGYGTEGSEISALDLLTPRERDVLQLLAEGHPTQEVASRLKVSVKTVGTHREHLMDKLGTHSLAGLTKFAIREGVTTLEE